MDGYIERQTLQDIADAIREKNGSSDTYKPSEMAEAIRGIEGGGEGFDFSEIYDNNLGTEINDFLKNKIQKGKTVFKQFNDKAISPVQYFRNNRTLDFIPNLNLPNQTELSFGFFNSFCRFIGKLNTPNCSNFRQTFDQCKFLIHIDYVDTSSAINTVAMFANCEMLKSIKLTSIAKITNDMSFDVLYELEKFKCDSWKQKNIGFISSSKLSASSIRYVIWHALNGENALGFENEGATSRTFQLHATPYASWEEWKLTKPSVEDCEFLGVDETEITKYGELTWEDIALNIKLITIGA